MKQIVLIICLVAALLTGCKKGSDLVLPQGTGMSDYSASHAKPG
jgi:hypothetical protein